MRNLLGSWNELENATCESNEQRGKGSESGESWIRSEGRQGQGIRLPDLDVAAGLLMESSIFIRNISGFSIFACHVDHSFII